MPSVDIAIEVGVAHGIGVDDKQFSQAPPYKRIGPDAVQLSQRFQHVQMCVVGLGADCANIAWFLGIGDWLPVVIEELAVTAMPRIVGLCFKDMKQLLRGGQRLGVGSGAVVGYQAVQREGV